MLQKLNFEIGKSHRVVILRKTMDRIIMMALIIIFGVCTALGKSIDKDNSTCQTTNDKGPQKNMPCIFPFKHQGVVYEKCGCILPFNKTYEQECTGNTINPKAKYWCSTRVNAKSEHISGGGNYGYCSRSCMHNHIQKTPSISPSKRIVESNDEIGGLCRITNMKGPKKNTSCVLPFTFEGVTYEECGCLLPFNGTYQRECKNRRHPNATFWCSTKVDENGEHVTGDDNYGYCDRNCEKSSGSIKFTPQTLLKEQFVDSFRKTSLNNAVYFNNNVSHNKGTWLPKESEGECGLETSTGYIVGGRNAKQGEFPYAAALGYMYLAKKDAKVLYICAGTLINRRYVVSAAHCFTSTPSDLSFVRVVLGLSDLSKLDDAVIQPSDQQPQVFSVSRSDVTVHENWLPEDITGGNDIALIRLPRVVRTIEIGGKHVLPICLPYNIEPEKRDILLGETLVVGWGKRGNFDRIKKHGAYSSKLNKIKVPMVDLETCRRKLFYQYNLWEDKHLCAGDEDHDSCNGDSGAPLLARKDSESPSFLFGIVSFGKKNCGSGAPGVYTKVESYIGWIASHLYP